METLTRPAIQLTGNEIDLLFQALTDWQNAPSRDGMGSALLGIMLTKPGDEERSEGKLKAQAEQWGAEIRKREERAILLKAKLIQYRSQLSEHDTE